MDPKEYGTVLGTAIKALERDLCDRCLGRQFAKSGFGLSNEQRGISVRTTLALELESRKDLPGNISPDVIATLPIHEKNKKEFPGSYDNDESKVAEWTSTSTPSFTRPWDEEQEGTDGCWLCNDIFDRVNELAQLVGQTASDLEFSTFLIGCRMDPQTVKREQMLWQDIDPPAPEPLKEELNREIGKRFFEMTEGIEVDKSDPDITFILDPLYRNITMQIKPVFIYGRYRKLVRGIPQTRWPCGRCHGKGCDVCNNTGRRYQISVEELIGELLKDILKGSDFKLHGMGREDVDVLCLGEGRPFILEVARPIKREIDLEMMKKDVNRSAEGKVEIDSLRFSSRKEIPKIKDGTTKKIYQVRITLDSTVDEETLKYNISLLGQSPIKQRTPTRVARRRADKIRTRNIHEMDLNEFDGKRAILTLTTDGGLYIKELMHGDDGRTVPSLSSLLGTGVTVDSLDVKGVLYDKNGN